MEESTDEGDGSLLSERVSLKFRFILNNGSSHLESSNIEELTRWEKDAVFHGPSELRFRGVLYERRVDLAEPGKDRIYRRILEYVSKTD